MNKKKYIYLELKETNGERTYYHRSVHAIGVNMLPEEYARMYAKDFYGEDGDYIESLESWFFSCGEVAIKIGTCVPITEDHYNTLNIYL